MNQFETRLRELRTEKNMSRAELAKTLQVTPRLVSYWEAGKRECSFDMLIAIADLFDTSVDYLLGRCDY